MANTYTLISSNVLTGSAASVTFSSIPATYTDLVLRIAARSTAAAISDVVNLELNGNTSTIYSTTILYGNGSSAGSLNTSVDASTRNGYYISGGSTTSNTFGSLEIYIPSYTVSQNKPISGFGVAETNAAAENMGVTAGLFRSTTAISSLKLTLLTGPNFDIGSSFYLYGIKNA